MSTEEAAQRIPPQALEAMGKYLDKIVMLAPDTKLDHHKVEEATAGVRRLEEVRALNLPDTVILQAVKNILEKHN